MESYVYEDEEAFLQNLLDRCVGIIVAVVIPGVRTVAMVVAAFFVGVEATHFNRRERLTIKVARTISREIQTITAR